MDTGRIRSVICDHLRNALGTLHRDGFVVGLSGGIDSTLSAHLAVEAVGPKRVLGVLMPERESSPESRELATDLVAKLGIASEEVDITPVLEALGAYSRRDEIVRKYYPDYRYGRDRVGIALHQNMTGSSLPPIHYLVVQNDHGEMVMEERIRLADYSALVAATNFKQRSRAVQLYYFADHRNYAVLGTTNRDELLLGFFVKLGDGAADVEGIEGFYKSELYALARAMGVDQRVIDRTPTTDTLPGQPSQRGYFYGLDFDTLDAGLAAMEGLLDEHKAMERSGLSETEMAQLTKNLKRRHDTTTILRSAPLGIGRAPFAGLI